MLNFILCLAALLPGCVAVAWADASAAERTSRATDPNPNVIVILADDMGYGDTSLNGHPAIRTPRLDQMAREGQHWTNFYVAASVCSPSRAGLLTGRLPVRSGLASSKHRVFFPWSKGGIPAGEFTLAELFKSSGYATALIGKWHLGHQPEFLPTRHGFDTWFGIPYSNDMDKTEHARAMLKGSGSDSKTPAAGWFEPESEWFQVPLMRDDTLIERAPDQRLLTRRYTDESIEFIRRHQHEPFFLYLSLSMPHVPLFRSRDFEGRSAGGLYGDVIEELDFSVGRILDELHKLNLEKRTLVVFTSDNGPWLRFAALGGSAGPFREGKSTAWEGGFRVPAIFWAPGTISPGNVQEMGSTLDFMRTFAALTGSDLPEVESDGFDLTAVLERKAVGPRKEMYFYLGDQLAAVRQGPFKAHFLVADPKNGKPRQLERPLLYNLDEDPGERVDLGSAEPEIVRDLEKQREDHRASVGPVENQLLRR